MSKDIMNINFVEATIAAADTMMQGFIDDMWASIDTSHTPSSIELVAEIKLALTNAGGTAVVFPFFFHWLEDAATQNTRMKAIWAAFTAGLTAAEGQSSYTTVGSVKVSAQMAIVWA